MVNVDLQNLDGRDLVDKTLPYKCANPIFFKSVTEPNWMVFFAARCR